MVWTLLEDEVRNWRSQTSAKMTPSDLCYVMCRFGVSFFGVAPGVCTRTWEMLHQQNAPWLNMDWGMWCAPVLRTWRLLNTGCNRCAKSFWRSCKSCATSSLEVSGRQPELAKLAEKSAYICAKRRIGFQKLRDETSSEKRIAQQRKRRSGWRNGSGKM